ncbi:MAG: TRAP transporter small permease [Alphaproteobacteria bacterium]|nr:TRAP transporter small permease [Alphaproteobacteria bacterium]
MFRLIDRIGDFLAMLAAWMFFAIGGMILWEVFFRYVFTSPTIWAEELARFFQIWALYIAAASVLRQGSMIRIGLLIDRLGPRARAAAEIFSLAVVAAFSAVACWYGGWIALDSFEAGRMTGTMLNVPHWMTEIAIPLGFAILLLQALTQIVRAIRGEPIPGMNSHEPAITDEI